MELGRDLLAARSAFRPGRARRVVGSKRRLWRGACSCCRVARSYSPADRHLSGFAHPEKLVARQVWRARIGRNNGSGGCSSVCRWLVLPGDLPIHHQDRKSVHRRTAGVVLEDDADVVSEVATAGAPFPR